MIQKPQEPPFSLLPLPILLARNKNKGGDRLLLTILVFIWSILSAVKAERSEHDQQSEPSWRLYRTVNSHALGPVWLDRLFFIYITCVIYLCPHLSIVNASSVIVPCDNCGCLLIIQWYKKLNIKRQFIKGLNFVSATDKTEKRNM